MRGRGQGEEARRLLQQYETETVRSKNNAAELRLDGPRPASFRHPGAFGRGLRQRGRGGRRSDVGRVIADVADVTAKIPLSSRPRAANWSVRCLAASSRCRVAAVTASRASGSAPARDREQDD